MLAIFSPQRKYRLWRALWIALAEAQRELGVAAVSDAQIDALKAQIDTIDFERARHFERITRHEVMAHLHAFAEQAPIARSILHLGATSAYVMDNGDLIQLRDALRLIIARVALVLRRLRDFCERYKATPTLGYTHFQPAQPTTVGRRAALWAQSLLFDLEHLERLEKGLLLLGAKGATGSQASYRDLGLDYATAARLDKLVAKKMGFPGVYPLSTQTYDRKIDSFAMNTLRGIAESAHKATNDIRLLSGLGELREKMGDRQVGSSAMAYKRNPISSERIASLAKFCIALTGSASLVAATQWLERSLDDSATRRLHIPQTFLAVDGILLLYHSTIEGLAVDERVISERMSAEAPMLAAEAILMLAVSRGGDRQTLHEQLRRLTREIQRDGLPNSAFIDRVAERPEFGIDRDTIAAAMAPDRLTGFSLEQTEHFLAAFLEPKLRKYRSIAERPAHIEL